MVTTMLAAARVSPSRVGAVINRNVGALRSGPSYWLVLLSGFFEPVLYLLSIGVGVGALVGDLALPGGRVVEYAVFVAPAMLAVSAMSGALAETTFNFFFKMKYSKTFEAILATPVKPFEIAVGELAWALVRSSVYTGAFLVVMVALGLTSPGWALAAFPATLLVGAAFGGVGMAISTLMRGWQDFDLLTTGQFALFLFSGTFSPVQDYPAAFEVVVAATPLFHAVELVRGLAVGDPGWGLLGHAAYLLVMGAVGLAFAARRIQRTLCV
ncbi:ABC transporter permease [Planomonospora venezuelensis]|uniref:Transport permease protein n=1 Tax=Planomonospora venezuelensis TaxID=1999 RepID=A0A841DFY5_PLAVE|nr:ABC transporter permease [Planomonospora venezuelensis]MBB5967917.1 lipooligosaccharide transport system permease protein [Planomonospora venezuelensis]GIN01788.1 transport permease protein [Planomonospora venezuelensis]